MLVWACPNCETPVVEVGEDCWSCERCDAEFPERKLVAVDADECAKGAR